jgi:hypothetical protein
MRRAHHEDGSGALRIRGLAHGQTITGASAAPIARRRTRPVSSTDADSGPLRQVNEMPSGSIGVAALPVSSTKSFWVSVFVWMPLLASPAMESQAAVWPHAKPVEPPKVAPPPTGPAYAFTFDTLLEDAKRRAQKPYSPQRSTLPAGLDKLSPEQYRSIHFNPDAGIWRNEDVPFRLELLRTGYNLQSVAVTVSTVDNGMAQDLIATPAMFDISPTLPQLGSKVSLPLSGFRVRTRSTTRRCGTSFWYSKARVISAPSPSTCCTGCRPADWPSIRRSLRARNFRPSRTFGWSGPRPLQLHRDLCPARERIGHRCLSLHGDAGHDHHHGCGHDRVSRAATCASSALHRSRPCFCSTRPTADGSTTTAPRCTTPTAS